MNENNSSGTNTVLIVVVLLIIVGFGVWWFTVRGGVGTPKDTQKEINVDIKLPSVSGTNY